MIQNLATLCLVFNKDFYKAPETVYFNKEAKRSTLRQLVNHELYNEKIEQLNEKNKNIAIGWKLSGADLGGYLALVSSQIYFSKPGRLLPDKGNVVSIQAIRHFILDMPLVSC